MFSPSLSSLFFPNPLISPHQHSTFHSSILTQHLLCLLSPPQPRLRVSTKYAAVIGQPSDALVDGIFPGAMEEEDQLPAGLLRESMPKHVAVVMDGNRRWARMRGFRAWEGYKAGFGALRGLVDLSRKWGIKVEIDFLINLFERKLRDELDEFARKDIRISVIGSPSKFPKSLQQLITYAEEATKNNSRLHLVVAVSYSGRYDIVQACQSIALKVKDGVIETEDINEFLVEQELETNCTQFPHPDLLIRTSGEFRVSNFLLWQLVDTELFFTQSHWPDFGEAEFLEALYSFQQRQCT